jgi:hypothetical protein
MAYQQGEQDRAYQLGIQQYYENTAGVQDAIDSLSVNIDTVAETQADAQKRTLQAEQRAARNRSRYNVNLTAAERNEMGKLNQRVLQANVSGAGNVARRTDRDLNLFRLQGLDSIRTALMDIGQTGQSALGAMATDRYNQYQQMRGQAKSQKAGFFGKIAGGIGSLLGSI